jgi:acetyl esterase/lipase
MKTETIKLSAGEDVTITTYLLDSSNEMPNTQMRPAVLLCPGGAYNFCSAREAEPVAMAFLAEGYHVFILRYSLRKNAKFPQPLRDAEESLSLIRENAQEWGVDRDKIAACGFSAGGHLAACLGTMGRMRPNALILIYPVIVNIPGHILAVPIPDADKAVDEQTPPVFIFHTRDDTAVPITHSLCFMNALDKAGVSFESYILQSGEHGFSLAKPVTSSGLKKYNNPDAAKWFTLCTSWLNRLGWGFKADGEFAVPNDVKKYSIDLPFGLLWANISCRKIIKKVIPLTEDNPQLRSVMSVQCRIVLEHVGIGTDMIGQIDRDLGEIPFTQSEE